MRTFSSTVRCGNTAEIWNERTRPSRAMSAGRLPVMSRPLNTIRPLLGSVSPWTLTALITGVVAFYASARSLQLGEGVEVIALTSVTANLTAIIGGILVFYDPIGSGPLEIAARCLAFCLVITGTALMPAPMRATEAPS